MEVSYYSTLEIPPHVQHRANPTGREHVLADLRPYICLSPDCHTPEETYQDRHEWMQHMLSNHWRTWACALGCDECFQSATAAGNHLAEIHANVSMPEDIVSLAGIHEGVRSLDATVDCPLCKKSNLTIKEYARHVGRHQKDLSLLSLPRDKDAPGNNKVRPTCPSTSKALNYVLIPRTRCLGCFIDTLYQRRSSSRSTFTYAR